MKFVDLPDELLEMIFETLSGSQILQCTLANKQLMSVCLPLLWRSPDIRTDRDLAHFIQTSNLSPNIWLALNYSSDISVYGNWIHGFELRVLAEILPPWQGSLNDQFALRLFNSFGARLKTLILNHHWGLVTFKHFSLNTIAQVRLVNLSRLIVEDCQCVDGEAMVELIRELPSLSTLQFNNTEWLTKSLLQKISHAKPQLRHLEIVDCHKIN